MPRKILRDDQHARIEGMLPGKATDGGSRPRTTACSSRRSCGSLAPARRGRICRRASALGTAAQRLAHWSDRGVWHRVFAELAQDADFEEVFLDSTIVRAHQDAAAAPKKTAIGRSRGGLSTKIHSLVEGLGNLARWRANGWTGA